MEERDGHMEDILITFAVAAEWVLVAVALMLAVFDGVPAVDKIRRLRRKNSKR